MTITIHPSTTQQSLMQQLNEVVYLSTEWWRIKELIESFNTTK
jgi:hypothetical protein